MIFNDILTALVLWLVWGLSPGPIILLSFSEILRSPKDGLKNGGMYLVIAWLTEFFIGLFLIGTAAWLKIPVMIFHGLAILGIAMLLFIAFQILKIRTIDYTQEQKQMSIFHIALFVLLNWPLWLFWISVCLPAAFRLGDKIYLGEYVFAIIFEIGVILGLAVMLFGFNSFRNFFSREEIVRRIFTALGILLILMAGRMAYEELLFFIG